jgi:hypothetical protein
MGASFGQTSRAFVMGLLIAACAPGTTATPAVISTPFVAPSADESASPAVATTVPSPVAQVPAPGGFSTPIPPDPATAWTGLGWRQLAPGDPLGRIQSIWRWSGGFVAVGNAEVTAELPLKPVWTSADGGIWTPLDPSAFGPAAILVGVGQTSDGLLALTAPSGVDQCTTGYPLPCWVMTGPVQAWTSSDGRNWASREGPDIKVPDEVGTYSIFEVLTAGTTSVVMHEGQPIARTRDGISWDEMPPDAVPAGWDGRAAVVTRSGFVAVGNISGARASTPVALLSIDGLAWTSSVIQDATAEIDRVTSRIVAGSDGLIAIGEEYEPAPDGETGSTRAPAVWWWSVDGRAWDVLPNYPPLGAMLGPDAQECFDACPDGILIGNGERMLAYRGGAEPVGWTSDDGRSWQPLTFTGARPTSPADLSLSAIILPIGVIIHLHDGSTWFGTPAI